MARTRTLLATSTIIALVLSSCGDDDPNTEDAVTDASTCAELRAAYDADSITDDEAELIATRLEEIAEADVADNGVLDDERACSVIIFELDPDHPTAFEGFDLETMGD